MTTATRPVRSEAPQTVGQPARDVVAHVPRPGDSVPPVRPRGGEPLGPPSYLGQAVTTVHAPRLLVSRSTPLVDVVEGDALETIEPRSSRPVSAGG